MADNKIIGVIQARMNSKRLPGKVLSKICGKPLIYHIYERLEKISEISDIVIATTNRESDKPLRDFAKSKKIPYYAGKVNDITDRLYKTGKKFNGDIIVKINADCPLIDVKLVSDGLKKFCESKKKPDLVTNCVIETYPEGMQYGIFNFETISKIWTNVKNPFWREYIFRYIIENKSKFKVISMENSKNLSSMRWTVDYPEDLKFVKKVYEKLYSKNQFFSMNDVLEIIRKYPELEKINQKYSAKIGINSFEELKEKFNQ